MSLLTKQEAKDGLIKRSAKQKWKKMSVNSESLKEEKLKNTFHHMKFDDDSTEAIEHSVPKFDQSEGARYEYPTVDDKQGGPTRRNVKSKELEEAILATKLYEFQERCQEHEKDVLRPSYLELYIIPRSAFEDYLKQMTEKQLKETNIWKGYLKLKIMNASYDDNHDSEYAGEDNKSFTEDVISAKSSIKRFFEDLLDHHLDKEENPSEAQENSSFSVEQISSPEFHQKYVKVYKLGSIGMLEASENFQLVKFVEVENERPEYFCFEHLYEEEQKPVTFTETDATMEETTNEHADTLLTTFSKFKKMNRGILYDFLGKVELPAHKEPHELQETSCIDSDIFCKNIAGVTEIDTLNDDRIFFKYYKEQKEIDQGINQMSFIQLYKYLLKNARADKNLLKILKSDIADKKKAELQRLLEVNQNDVMLEQSPSAEKEKYIDKFLELVKLLKHVNWKGEFKTTKANQAAKKSPRIFPKTSKQYLKKIETANNEQILDLPEFPFSGMLISLVELVKSDFPGRDIELPVNDASLEKDKQCLEKINYLTELMLKTNWISEWSKDKMQQSTKSNKSKNVNKPDIERRKKKETKVIESSVSPITNILNQLKHFLKHNDENMEIIGMNVLKNDELYQILNDDSSNPLSGNAASVETNDLKSIFRLTEILLEGNWKTRALIKYIQKERRLKINQPSISERKIDTMISSSNVLKRNRGNIKRVRFHSECISKVNDNDLVNEYKTAIEKYEAMKDKETHGSTNYNDDHCEMGRNHVPKEHAVLRILQKCFMSDMNSSTNM